MVNGSKHLYTTRCPCSEPLPQERTARDPCSGYRPYVPGRVSAPHVRKAALPCPCGQLGTHPQDTEVTSQGEFCPSGKESRVIVSCGQLGTHPQGTVGCAPRNCAGLAMPPHAICRRRTAAPPWQGVQVQLPLRASSQLNERFYFAIILGR